jgi:hypothetical protein
VCTPAINILEDMGVLKELMDNNEAHFADAGALYYMKLCTNTLWRALQGRTAMGRQYSVAV